MSEVPLYVPTVLPTVGTLDYPRTGVAEMALKCDVWQASGEGVEGLMDQLGISGTAPHAE